MPRECHYTYPPDGDLHTSIRTFHNANRSRLASITHIYADRKKIKTFSGNGETTSRSELPLTDLDEADSLRAAGYRPPPLASYATEPLFFGFPTMSLGRPTEAGFEEIVVSDLREGDLVVPCRDSRVNLSMSLTGFGWVEPSGPGPSPHLCGVDHSSYPRIRLTAIYT